MCVSLASLSCKEETITKASSSWNEWRRSRWEMLRERRDESSGKYILTGERWRRRRRRKRRHPQGLFSLFQRDKRRPLQHKLSGTSPSFSFFCLSENRWKNRKKKHFAHVGQRGRKRPCLPRRWISSLILLLPPSVLLPSTVLLFLILNGTQSSAMRRIQKKKGSKECIIITQLGREREASEPLERTRPRELIRLSQIEGQRGIKTR